MSGSLAHITQPEAAPPRTGVRRWLSALLALLVIAGSFALGPQAAHAGSEGVGYWSDGAFLGAYNTDVDGRQAYCADLDADPPYGNTSGPERIEQWYQRALTGVAPPYPSSLRFLEDQGEWYTPFNHPGMTGPYDIRRWHDR